MTKGEVGSVRSVLQEHSITPYYFPFHPPWRVERWVDQMRYGNAQNVKAEMGLLASRLGAAHPLKACSQCMAIDLEMYGVAYWHVVHQLPGVLVCTRHRHPLTTTQIKVSGLRRFDWFLPAQVISNSTASAHPCTVISLRLTEFCEGFWSRPVGFHFELERFHNVIRARLMLLGALRANGRYEPGRLHEILTPLAAFHENTVSWHGIEHLDVEALGYSLRRLLSTTASRGLHPLKYALVLCVLYPSWTDFWHEYSDNELGIDFQNVPDIQSLESSAPVGKRELLEMQFLDCLRNQGMSVTAASKTVNVAVATGLRWAASHGFEWKRRGKLLRPTVLNNAITLLTQGMEKVEVAKAVGASVQTVTMILSTDPDLRSRWHQIRYEQAKRNARSTWQEVLETMQQSSLKQCRMVQSAAFAWLYRNDLAWLKKVNSERPRVPRAPPSLIRWDVRDKQLAQLVNEAVLARSEEDSKQRISVAWLRTQLPALNSMMSNLDRLPLTRFALEWAIKPQRGNMTSELPF